MAKEYRVTKSNSEFMARLKKDNIYFSEEHEIARFAFAYVMKMNLDRDAKNYSGNCSENKWHAGTLDPDGTMIALLKILYPDFDCEDLLQKIINIGLEQMTNEFPPGIDCTNLSSLMNRTMSDNSN